MNVACYTVAIAIIVTTETDYLPMSTYTIYKRYARIAEYR